MARKTWEPDSLLKELEESQLGRLHADNATRIWKLCSWILLGMLVLTIAFCIAADARARAHGWMGTSSPDAPKTSTQTK